MTVTVPASVSAWAISPSLTATVRTSTDSVLILAAAQVEADTSASPWSLGGGAPVVTVDDVPLTLPRSGYVDPELHLMEV